MLYMHIRWIDSLLVHFFFSAVVSFTRCILYQILWANKTLYHIFLNVNLSCTTLLFNEKSTFFIDPNNKIRSIDPKKFALFFSLLKIQLSWHPSFLYLRNWENLFYFLFLNIYKIVIKFNLVHLVLKVIYKKRKIKGIFFFLW